MRPITSFFLSSAILVGGCATPYQAPLPQAYAGPVATMWDDVDAESSSKGQVFYIESIDDKPLESGYALTQQATFGKGFNVHLERAHYFVPVRPLKLHVVGTHVTGAPIHAIGSALTGNFHRVEGDLVFTPEEGRAYVVTGRLQREGSAVWIADWKTRERVSPEVTSRSASK
jgi:hypothetical protein